MLFEVGEECIALAEFGWSDSVVIESFGRDMEALNAWLALRDAVFDPAAYDGSSLYIAEDSIGVFICQESDMRKKPKPGDQSFDELIDDLKNGVTA